MHVKQFPYSLPYLLNSYPEAVAYLSYQSVYLNYFENYESY